MAEIGVDIAAFTATHQLPENSSQEELLAYMVKFQAAMAIKSAEADFLEITIDRPELRGASDERLREYVDQAIGNGCMAMVSRIENFPIGLDERENAALLGAAIDAYQNRIAELLKVSQDGGRA